MGAKVKNNVARTSSAIGEPYYKGRIDKIQLTSFLQSLNSDPAQQAFWAQQEKLFCKLPVFDQIR